MKGQDDGPATERPAPAGHCAWLGSMRSPAEAQILLEALTARLEAGPFSNRMRSALHLAVCCLAAGLVGTAAAQSTAPGKPQPTPTPTPQPGVFTGNPTGGQKPQPTPTPPPRRDPFSPQPYPQKPPPSETPLPAVVNDLDWPFTVKAGPGGSRHLPTSKLTSSPP